MTAHQLRKITIDQLRPGMHVSNVFNKQGTLLYSANTHIKTEGQIEALRRQGVETLTINLQKGTGEDVPHILLDDSNSKPEEHRSDYSRKDIFTKEEVDKAIGVRENAAAAVRDIMTSAKSGRMFSIDTVVSSVESIVDSVFENPDIMLNLCRIRSHAVDAYTHSVNVAVMMVGFSSAIGLPQRKVIIAGVGGLLHDIGLVTLPDELFIRQGSCTRQEMELFKKHPKNGYDMIKRQGVKMPEGVLEIICQHHERLNGTGYPGNIFGSNIHELAFICAITDTYDTLTTHGMYNRIYLPQEALALMFQGADEDVPRSMIEHFTKLLGIYPVGSFVKLDTKEMGVVIKNNRKRLLAPAVRILFDKDGNRLMTPYIKDLSVTDYQSGDQLARILYSLDPSSHKIEVDQYIIEHDP